MTERADVVVVGGGMIGVCAAYFLAERGVDVVLAERQVICSGASYGNAGWIFPSHSTPLPAPGVMRHALRWLLDDKSPLYIRPRLDVELLRWLLAFLRASTGVRARRTFELNRELGLASREIYEKISPELGSEVHFSPHGLLVVCASQEAFAEARAEMTLLEELGGEATLLDVDQARAMAPCLSSELRGAIYLPVDAHVQPARFVEGLAAEATRAGVRIQAPNEVLRLERRGSRWIVSGTHGDIECEHVVLAGGAWLEDLAKPLGIRVPIQAAKGYSVTVRAPEGVGETPLMLSDAKVGVSCFGSELRFAGTLELAGRDMSIDPKRVGAILDAVARFMPGLGELERIETWRGLRPCTPDDLPVIGAPRQIPTLMIAGGHGMSGISQGPITGQLVADLILGESPSLDVSAFSPDRFR